MAYIFKNNWGFSLAVDDNGKIAHQDRNEVRNGWEGFRIEYTNPKTCFISREKGNNKIVLAIDDNGNVCTTGNRVKVGWEEFLITADSGKFMFSRVKAPHYTLAQDFNGKICTTMNLQSNGWEGWTLK